MGDARIHCRVGRCALERERRRKAIFDALNVVYDGDEKRGIVKLNAMSLSFTLVGIVILMIVIAAVVVVPLVLALVGLPPNARRACFRCCDGRCCSCSWCWGLQCCIATVPRDARRNGVG